MVGKLFFFSLLLVCIGAGFVVVPCGASLMDDVALVLIPSLEMPDNIHEMSKSNKSGFWFAEGVFAKLVPTKQAFLSNLKTPDITSTTYTIYTLIILEWFFLWFDDVSKTETSSDVSTAS